MEATTADFQAGDLADVEQVREPRGMLRRLGKHAVAHDDVTSIFAGHDQCRVAVLGDTCGIADALDLFTRADDDGVGGCGDAGEHEQNRCGCAAT